MAEINDDDVVEKEKICIGIDSIDRLFKMCEAHICKLKKWETPGDEAHGKGWASVRAKWESTMHKLAMEDFTIVNIVHEKVEEQTINRTKVNRIVMNLPSRAKDIVSDSSDFILYYGLNENGDRTLFCKPSVEHEIGRRGQGDLDMSPIDPNYKAINERIEKETGSSLLDLAPMLTIIGRPKIGKTTLLSEFPNMVLFDCENGSKFLKGKFKRVFKCKDWASFIDGIKIVVNRK